MSKSEMSKPKFEVLISKEYFGYYMDKMGCYVGNPVDEEWETLTAEELEDMSRTIAFIGNAEKVAELAEAYGCNIKTLDGLDELIVHIADEIIESCCRTVFEH